MPEEADELTLDIVVADTNEEALPLELPRRIVLCLVSS
jgi:hypothetical protein